MTRLWLVRHGPTHAKSMIGWSDLPADLSDTAAIDRLADSLPDAPVLSSDLGRASATADAIGRDRHRLPDDPALREINFGTWEQRRFDEVEAETPDLIRDFWQNPGPVAPPGGESWDMLRARVDRAIDARLGDHPDLIVVCHFGAILTQLQRALGVPTTVVFGHKIDPLSVTEITWSADGWTVGRINRHP